MDITNAFLIYFFTFADSVVTLYPLPSLSPPTVLAPTRNASVFALDTSVQYELADGSLATPAQSGSKGIATVVTVLVVGCKRKIVVYRWHDGDPQPVKVIKKFQYSLT